MIEAKQNPRVELQFALQSETKMLHRIRQCRLFQDVSVTRLMIMSTPVLDFKVWQEVMTTEFVTYIFYSLQHESIRMFEEN